MTACFSLRELPPYQVSVTSDAVRWGGGHMLTIAIVAAIVAVTVSVLVGRDGVTHLLELRTERQRLGEQAVALLEANAALRDQIKRLKTDDHHLEALARHELGLVRPNEVVYRFRRPPMPADRTR